MGVTKEVELGVDEKVSHYEVNPPFASVEIRKEGGSRARYIAIEPDLTHQEREIDQRLRRDLLAETIVPREVMDEGGERLEDYLNRVAERILQGYRIKLPMESQNKILYLLRRDFLGYGKLDLLMRDPHIEDISCDGVGIPVYVWHRKYESIPSSVTFTSEKEVTSIISRLAYRAEGQLTIANPIFEGTLPQGFRIHLTLDEVSKRGSTFTIRKFPEESLTMLDMIKHGTISAKMAAYLWLLVEYQNSIIILGPTAAGKTSILNAIAMFIKPEEKIVTIEETREIRLPHENWIPDVTRSAFQAGAREISLFDLLKSALRQRPDYLIVGEVRGNEAYSLFQAISVGHGGLATMHAESAETATKRLLTEPMNIPLMLIPLVDMFVLMGRVKIGKEIVRRVLNLSEVVSVKESNQSVELNKVFEWTGEKTDDFTFSGKTFNFMQISMHNHIAVEEIYREMDNRESILKAMVERKITTFQELATIVRQYYSEPDRVLKQFGLGEK